MKRINSNFCRDCCGLFVCNFFKVVSAVENLFVNTQVLVYNYKLSTITEHV